MLPRAESDNAPSCAVTNKSDKVIRNLILVGYYGPADERREIYEVKEDLGLSPGETKQVDIGLRSDTSDEEMKTVTLAVQRIEYADKTLWYPG